MPKKVNCPQCGKTLEWTPENRYRPFCSERCKLIDFGAWAKEEHTIPGDPSFEALMSAEKPQKYH